MARLAYLILIASVLTACDGAVTSFVTQGQSDDPTRALSATGPIPLKVTPGAVQNVGSSLSMKATITPTDQTFQSGQISAQMTLHRQRVNPQ